MAGLIPDWPDFDHKVHFYSVATGGGDGWEATSPISVAIAKDLVDVAENLPDEEEAEMLEDGFENWVDSLYVFRKDDEDANIIAEFCLRNWRWF